MLVLCLLTCLVAVCQSDSAISDCSVKCSSDCQCPCQSVNTKPLWKYTKMRGKGLFLCIYHNMKYLLKLPPEGKNKKPVADAPCVFDPSGEDKCGRLERTFLYFSYSLLFYFNFISNFLQMYQWRTTVRISYAEMVSESQVKEGR